MVDVPGALEVLVYDFEICEAVADGDDMRDPRPLRVLDGEKLFEVILVYETDVTMCIE
jgi:hypothetical protein